MTTTSISHLKLGDWHSGEVFAGRNYEEQLNPGTLPDIASGFFSVEEPGRYQAIVDNLLNNDNYLLLADYESYIATQDEVGKLYQDQEEWSRRAILNVARMAKFSSDRTIAEYASQIWHAQAMNKKPSKPARLKSGVNPKK